MRDYSNAIRIEDLILDKSALVEAYFLALAYRRTRKMQELGAPEVIIAESQKLVDKRLKRFSQLLDAAENARD